MILRKQGHSVYYCKYHIILTTKYRRKVFRAAGVHEYFSKLLRKMKIKYPDVEIEENNHDMDHVHLLMSIPPKYSVAEIIRTLKCNTGKQLKDRFEYIQRLYWGSDGIWSDGYLATTAGINETTIKMYIQKQGEEDSGQTLFG